MSLLFTSCDLFTKVQSSSSDNSGSKKSKDELDVIQGRKVYDPVTGTYVIVEETPTEIMDTIRWQDIPEGSYPPITSDGSYTNTDPNKPELLRRGDKGSEFYSAYNIAMVLPFLTHRFDANRRDIYPNSNWAINYYGGVRMALDDLSQENIKVNLAVMDSQANESQMKNLLRTNSDLKNANLIIGPYRKANVKLVADFAKRNKITFLSPYNASSELSPNNPDYIQVAPTLKTHCEALTRHARKRFRADQITLVCRNKPAEIARFQYFHDENERVSLWTDTTRFQEYIVSEESLSFEDVDMLPFIELKDTMVFIIPSWSNETFVYSFLRKLDLINNEDNLIVVYGMPQWMRFEKIDFDYFEKLNVHVSSNTFLDYYDTEVQFFRKRFFRQYGAPPTDAAFLGYDTMMFCGRMLQKHGTKFQYWLDQESIPSLHTRFEFDQVIVPIALDSRIDPPDQQFQNTFVHILKFDEFQFQPAN